MKYIKFIMSGGEPILVTKTEAERILKSSDQLVPIKEKGNWEGQTINKAHVIQTFEDTDYSIELEKTRIRKLENLKATPEFLKKWRVELKNKMGW